MSRRYAPPVHDLSSTTGLSLCSSPSTITCSVWSSGRSMASSFDVLSTILPMSTITFASAISDDEDDITLDHQQTPHSLSSMDDGSNTSSFNRQDHRNTTGVITDPFALSERSLFEDPTRRIDPSKKFDNAPMAPLRQQQQEQQRLLLEGNQKWTTTSPSPTGSQSPRGVNMETKPGFMDQTGRQDVKPRMPTRSFHGDEKDEDGSNLSDTKEPSNKVGHKTIRSNNFESRFSYSESLHDVPTLPATRRERLAQRLAAVQRIIVDPIPPPATAGGGCRLAPIFNMNDKSDPPKLPIRTTHDDMTESATSDDDDDDSGDGFACDVIVDAIPVPKKEEHSESDDNLQTTTKKARQHSEGSTGTRSTSTQEGDIQPNNAKTTPKQRIKKAKVSKATTSKSSTSANKKKAAVKKGAEPEEPITDKSSYLMDHCSRVGRGDRRRYSATGATSTVERRADKRLLRPRSKDPPQRFATAPASLSSSKASGVSNRKSYIPKRRVRSNKSSERRNRRQFVSNSLASILEDENENTTSPVREEPKAPASCPSAIETSGLEERYDSVLDLDNRFPSKSRGGRSWAGTASRNLL